MTTVLVTGAGAIIGYGIIRSLRTSEKEIQIIGADIFPDAVGQAWTDKFVVAPYTSSAEYSDWLKSTIIRNEVDLVIPGIEQDVHFISEYRDNFSDLPVTLALNDRRLIRLSKDKWLMHQELLESNSDARIASYLDVDFDRISRTLGLPFIVKPRKSYASKGLVRVSNRSDFAKAFEQLGSELMAQPIVGNDDEEYTVGVFGDGRGKVCSSIIFQRRLAPDGSTVKAWVRQNSELDEVIASLCAHFKPIGPTNLQFRKDGEYWGLLEINPRVSSSTSIRTAFGYNEAEMCLDFYLEGKDIVQPIIRNGFAARYIEDKIFNDRNHF